MEIIAIIAAEGSLPIECAKKCLADGKEVCVVSILPNPELAEFLGDNIEIHSLKTELTRVGKILDFIRSKNATKICFVGKMKMPKLSSLIPRDIKTTKLLGQLLSSKLKGDDHILTRVVQFMEAEGFKVIGIHEILTDVLPSEISSLTKTKPNKEDLKTIQFAQEVLDHISTLDIGQAIVVSEERVMGIEAAEGTKELIQRCKNYREGRKILVKKPKIGQDLRVDMPTIGLETIKDLVENGYSGIAISRNVMVLEKEKCIALANKKGIFIELV